MAIRYTQSAAPCRARCSDKFGCPDGVVPDFMIRRHDTKPSFKVFTEDCNGAMDFRGLVVEANMWALARLKAELDEDAEYFRLADDIGFEQVMVGDIIVMDRVRLPERMLVIGFDETNKLIKVQRGYHGTTPSLWSKGSVMRIFRIMGAPAYAEMEYEDVLQVDGTTEYDVLQGSYLVYDWQPGDTCLPGCYYFEFKLLKMIELVLFLPGGHWTGERHVGDGDFYHTGTATSDSSVRLSYDQIEDRYLLPEVAWQGERHLHTDDSWYTGSAHDDGSVLLNSTGVPSSASIAYNEEGLAAQAVSVTPSFTDPSLDESDFGCHLGEGVEWARRFPLEGEGFLIKIEFSPTTEV